MAFRVRATSRVHRDITSFLNWLSHEKESPRGAASWLRAYDQAVKLAARSPFACGLAPENGLVVDCEIRQFLFKTRRGRFYRALFTIKADEMVILRVRGPGQPLLEPHELK